MKTERMLIVADDSPSSLKAIKYGFYLAALLEAKVALIGVVNEALAIGNVDAGVFPEGEALTCKRNMENFLSHVIEDYADGKDVEVFTPEGDVKDTVLDLAREWEATMIVAGTHGRKGLNRLLMGSIAEGILRDAKVPVVVVPLDRQH